MNSLELIAELRKLHISIKIINGDLKLSAPKGLLSKDLVSLIREKKLEIINILSQNESIIVNSEKKDFYRMSSSQKRLFTLQLLDTNSKAYNIQWIIQLGNKVNKSKIETDFKQLISRHESLRTSFELIEDEPIQRIQESVEFKIEEYLIDKSEETGIRTNFIRSFDLSRAPLFRVAIIEIKGGSSLLMIDMHHIISDASSDAILEREFVYLLNNKSLSPIRLQYKDYSEWQHDECRKERIKVQEQYWLNKYAGDLPKLNLPLDYIRPSIQSFEGASVSFVFSEEETSLFKSLAMDNGLTLYMSLLTVYNILLSKLSGQEDIVVGTPFAGRNHADLENIVGMFVNTLAMRNEIRGDYTLTDLLKRVRQTTLEAFENQEYQFEDLVEQVSSERDVSRNPIFDVMFNLFNQGNYQRDLRGFDSSNYIHTPGISKFDLSLSAVDFGEQLLLSFEYCTKLFRPETIERYIRYFKQVVNQIVFSPGKEISGIDILSPEEKHQLLYEFNNTQATYPKDKTLAQLFEEQVEKTPDRVAIIEKDHHVTYSEFNKKTIILSKHLSKQGLEKGMKVGLLKARSIDLMIDIYGIIKSGSAYVPIDIFHPTDRVTHIINDSKIDKLIIGSGLSEKVKNSEGLIIPCIPLQSEYTNASEESYVSESISSTDLAYVIYTSGSTGSPKGVLIEHHSVVNRIHWMQKSYPIGKGDILIQKTPYSFDVSVWELFWWFFNGSCLNIFPQGGEKEPSLICDSIEKNGISVIHFVPSMLDAFLEYFSGENLNNRIKSLKYVFCSGEALKVNQVNNFFKQTGELEEIRLINLYGPTEATVDVSCFECFREELYSIIPIGKPISNTQLYVLDKPVKHLQPIGVTGELCISGVQLSRGYLGNDELTSAKFIGHPFKEGERLYRTGDLARWLPDGNIEFLGRIDHQVKIRGFRIELGEIENVLLKHEFIKECVVLAREVKEEKYLCAYIVSKKRVTQDQLQNYLSEYLPDYMIPSYFVDMDEFPLTSNGKINREILPVPEVKAGDDYVAPSNETEKKLAAIWSGVLNISQEEIGVAVNFFAIGGHSLKATILIGKIYKETGVEFPLRDVFLYPTIREQAFQIDSGNKKNFLLIPKAKEQPYYQLSSAQKRLYLLQQMDLCSTVYNMPYLVFLGSDANKAKIEEVFYELISRHESLRTSFELIEDEPIQRIQESVEFKIEEYLIDKSEETGIRTNFIRSFDLSRAPLFRVAIIEIKGGSSLLMIDMHHIISDASSDAILEREFVYLLNNKSLSPIRLQYKDYSEWQHDECRKERIKVQEQYWLNKYAGDLPKLNLPLDYIRPSIQSFEGASVSFVFSEEETSLFKSLAMDNGLTLYMSLLTVYNILLSKLSGQEDIVVGTPFAGRNHADLENIVGMFVNTLAMRNEIRGDYTLTDLLKRVRQTTLEAFENQEYQFEDLVEQVSSERDVSRNPIFDVMFNLFNQGNYQRDLRGFDSSNYIHTPGISKFDLSLSAVDFGEQLLLSFEYCTKLFRPETIERYIRYFKQVVNQIVFSPGKEISGIDILSPEEKHQLLYEFNNTQATYPKDKTLAQLFEEQVEKTPDRVAIIEKDHHVTYSEFNKKTIILSKHLSKQGLEKGMKVGLLKARSIDLMIDIYGIIKSGSAYVPIDIFHPTDRVTHIINDSKIDKLIIGSGLSEKVKNSEGLIIPCIPLQSEYTNASEESYVSESISSTDLAYVIYTSGSTGSPKGVLIEHHSVVNRIHWMQKSYPIGKGDILIQKTPYSFDVSVWELFWWFFNGSCLNIFPQGGEKEPSLICDSIEKNGISVIHFVPSMLDAFLEYFSGENLNNRIKSLKYVFCSGEALKVNQVNNFFKQTGELEEIRLINLYGPTEATVDVSCFECFREELYSIIPIGKPISNTQLYVLDKPVKHLQPIGVTGELCISGVQLSRGYLGNDELTSAKFIGHPFKEGERLYRTGDLARWLPDGNIEFLGRIDHQVKIRGFRIELGEIENVLLKHEFIKECVVLAREVKEEKYLCAYIVSKKRVTQDQLQNYLSEYLPDYMIPSYFVDMDEFPLTSNGKINREILPVPEVKAGDDYVAPSNETEKKLAAIWSKILNVQYESIGRNSDFFDLGGHSLKITLLISKIHKEFDVKLLFADAYKHSVLSKLAEHIYFSGKDAFAFIPNTEKREYYPLTKSQRGISLFQEMNPDSRNYNIPAIIPLNDNFEIERFEKAFITLIKRHESLRTSIGVFKNELYQRVHEEFKFIIPVYNTNQLDLDEILNKMLNSFRLDETPLIRACVLKIPNKKPSLIVNLHHIISDEFSLDLLMEEFKEIIDHKKLFPLRYQFKDFAVWQNEDLRFLKKQELHKKYWLSKFNKEIPMLNLPLDYSRETGGDFEGERLQLVLSIDETRGIQKIVESFNTSTFVAILSIYYIWLMKLSGDEDIIIGTPVSGRYHENLNRICGMFVNTIALRNYPEKNKQYSHFLTEIHKNVLNDFENQFFSFDELVGLVCKERKENRNPIFDVYYTFSNKHKDTVTPDNRKELKQEEIWRIGVKFDLFFSGLFENDQIILHIDYRKSLFDRNSMEYYLTILKKIINQLIHNLNINLSDIAKIENTKINIGIVNELDEDF